MILSTEDFDFIEGFVKQAYDLGATEAEASVLLAAAYPYWKASTTDPKHLEDLKKSASFTSSLRGLGHSLGGVAQHGLGTAYHGIKTPLMGAGKGLMAAGRGVGAHPVAATALGASAATAYGAKKLYDWGTAKDDWINPAGLSPSGTSTPGGGVSTGGAGTFGASGYSPHGAYIQSKLDSDYWSGGAVAGDEATPPNSDPRDAKTGTQWDQAFKAGQTDIKGLQTKAKAIQDQLTAVQHSGLDPVRQHQETTRLQGELTRINSMASQRQTELGKLDETLQSQQRAYGDARASNQQIVTRRLGDLQEQATNWAKAQQDRENASWFLPKAYYGVKNWMTGNSPAAGDHISQELQGFRATQDQLNSQPNHYFHNY